MHRTDAPNNESNLFADFDPVLGKTGTTVDAAWLNAVQEELCNLLVAMGVTLTKGTNNQLLGAAVAAATANKLVRRDASGRAQFADPSAAADAATKGYVDPRAARAWGSVAIDSGVITVRSSHGIGTPTLPSEFSGYTFRVPFTSAMANANYAVLVIPHAAMGQDVELHAQFSGRTTAQFDIKAGGETGGISASFSTGNWAFDFIVFGT